jgi:hypothetical protein
VVALLLLLLLLLRSPYNKKTVAPVRLEVITE